MINNKSELIHSSPNGEDSSFVTATGEGLRGTGHSILRTRGGHTQVWFGTYIADALRVRQIGTHTCASVHRQCVIVCWLQRTWSYSRRPRSRLRKRSTLHASCNRSFHSTLHDVSEASLPYHPHTSTRTHCKAFATMTRHHLVGRHRLIRSVMQAGM